MNFVFSRYLNIAFCFLSCLGLSCSAQEKKESSAERVTSSTVTSIDPSKLGGPCEGCEALFEFGKKKLTWSDTLPGFSSNEPQILVEGIVYENDGRTPAAGVVIYAYHTDREGFYSYLNDPVGWEKRHGSYRGWVRTDSMGRYRFYTFRPASYPDRNEPEHIHLTVQEPNKKPYYIDGVVFDDDPLLTAEKRRSLSNRGGTGIVMPDKRNKLWVCKRDIILGKNIPNYF